MYLWIATPLSTHKVACLGADMFTDLYMLACSNYLFLTKFVLQAKSK